MTGLLAIAEGIVVGVQGKFTRERQRRGRIESVKDLHASVSGCKTDRENSEEGWTDVDEGVID
jgi:hypothetical protein